MKTLSIDIETYSDVPLQKTGAYRYVESPNFEILLFAYSTDNQPVQVIDPACGEQIPKEVFLALEDEFVIKWAWALLLFLSLRDLRICPTGKGTYEANAGAKAGSRWSSGTPLDDG